MSAKLHFDSKASERLLAVYITSDMVAQRQQIISSLHLQSGDKVLDVGSGPGFLASSMADIVGASGEVCGIDISEPLLEIAAAYCASQPWVHFQNTDATQLPFTDDHFDVAVVTQVLEYVTDVDAALLELQRILRPGGRVLIVDTDWDSIVWHTTDRSRMNRILEAWDEHLVDPYLPRTLAMKLHRAGFQVVAQEVVPLFNPKFDKDAFSNKMIDLISSFVIGRHGISAEEVDAWAQELRHIGDQGSYFFSLNRYLFIGCKS